MLTDFSRAPPSMASEAAIFESVSCDSKGLRLRHFRSACAGRYTLLLTSR